jgi:flagellar biosynthetic protein FliQ
MSGSEATLDIIREALVITLKIATPILLAGVVIGLVISVLQSVTQIQDQALTFVPKIIVMLLASLLLIPWIVDRLVAFTQEMFVLH